MSTGFRKYRLGMIFSIVLWLVSMIVSPALAQGETEPDPPEISFVQEGELTFGPPLPQTIDLVINIKNIGDQYSNLDLQVINLTDDKGNNLSPSSIQTSPCEYAEKKVQTNIKDQTLIRRVCLNPQDLKSGTYTAILQATLGSLAQTTKSIKLVVGPEVTILNSEITVLGTACPILTRTNIRTMKLRDILCPKFGNYNLYTVAGTDIIAIAGYSENNFVTINKFFGSASGTLVSAEGAGTIFAQLVPLDDKTYFTACHTGAESTICSRTRLKFWGPFKAGTYSGIFYLDPKDRSNDATKIQITLKVKDHWLLPSLFILLGLLVSAWVTWQLGPRKNKKEQKATEDVIIKKRNELENRLHQFREEIAKTEQNLPCFVEDPDIMLEAEFLLSASKDASDTNQPIDILTHIENQDLAQRMILIAPLFVRLRFFYLALYKLYVWAFELPNKTPGKSDLEKKIEGTRQKLWTADSESKMDEAQDELIQTYISAHSLYWTSKNKLIIHPPKFKLEMLPVKNTVSEAKSLPRRPWTWMVNSLKTLLSFLISLLNIPNFLRWAIVLLSGIYVVYATNPTFGTPQDYIYAFLWGSATNAGIEFVTKFLGANNPILSAISGITK